MDGRGYSAAEKRQPNGFYTVGGQTSGRAADVSGGDPSRAYCDALYITRIE